MTRLPTLFISHGSPMHALDAGGAGRRIICSSAWRERAPAAARAHPTEEHFLPLFVSLGAAGPGAAATRVYSAIDAGVLSMDAYRFDLDDVG